ncbi:lipopolysaccharide biosynthesis protein [uncultured Fibrobacter sp.]|uniref:lipopolysaccharide biosynthesis protein n=1 Tax=uncultured Fibrobacter sp. TaxID=261512 RepID=UPI0025D02719|nr:lipopolysaccharide biosynthesis protein [uncultured Fibrobacter sp.]
MPSKRTIISSLFWKYLERMGTQITQFVVSIVLARILAPDDFGLVAIVTIFIALANVFVQSGLNTALIQQKDSDDLDFASVFIASFSLAGVLYIVLFFTAPVLAEFYHKEHLTPILRVLSLLLFLGSINSIQLAYISRHMMFKKLFFRSLGAIIPSGAIGIACAAGGLGAWALVAQQLSNMSLAIIIMWFTVPWRPQLQFSFNRLKGLLSFGWKLLLSSLIDSGYENLRGLLIGKMFTPADLAFYNRGDHFPNIVVCNVNSTIQSVMLPSLAAHQDDKPQVKRLMRRAIITSSFLILPLMTGLAIAAKPLVLVLLGEKWLPTVPYIHAYCFVYAFYPIHTSNLSAINAMGRSDIFLKLEIIKKAYGIALLVAVLLYFKSPIGIAYGVCVSSVISSIVNAFPNKRLVQYSYLEQFKDIFPSVFLTAVMGVVLYLISLVDASPYLTLVLEGIVGIVCYIGLAKILHFECLDYLIKTIKEFTDKHA